MPALEPITIQLGTAIAKVILKLWLKDSAIAQDTSISILGILSRKIPDLYKQRRIERQLAELTDQISVTLLPLFNRASLTDNSTRAVGLSAAKTLNNAQITSTRYFPDSFWTGTVPVR